MERFYVNINLTLNISQYLLYTNTIIISFQSNNDTWDYYSFDMTDFSNNHLVYFFLIKLNNKIFIKLLNNWKVSFE